MKKALLVLSLFSLSLTGCKFPSIKFDPDGIHTKRTLCNKDGECVVTDCTTTYHKEAIEGAKGVKTEVVK